ncbi:MAG: phospho-N-acetylmuramoyl-pentapeptide-transferase [Bryobacteraceae bacterium]
MLYWLLYEKLFRILPPFRVFGYVTVRTFLASITALLVAILAGPWMIRRLHEMQIGQPIREDGPETHFKKAGTPTMGGLLIITAIVVPTLLFANLANLYVWVALLGLLGFGAIGFLDDHAKIRRGRNLGLTARQKMLLQILLVLLLGGILMTMERLQLYSTAMNVPFFKSFRPGLLIGPLMRNLWTWPLAFLPFFAFLWLVVVGCSNSVNLTDGLDGLAVGLMIISAGAMTVLCYISGHARFANYLDIARLPGAAELTVFCAAMTGACIGFLWYNAHPAEVFMGDVGSLALGGGLGVVAVLIKQELLLPFIGGVYVIETLSVIIQVGSFKSRGKRVFLMTPIHHHFEKLGWTESKIIIRFWIAGLILALFALTTLKLR